MISPLEGRPALREAGGAALLLLAGVLAVWGGFSAPFLAYDDAVHALEHRGMASGASWRDVLLPHPSETYFPLTILSYRLDRALFEGWMPAWLGSWAPGVRAMNVLYHVLAAWILWRVLMRLGLARGAAFLLALVFAAHPLACETVCWVSERKNALAGLFGFLTLFAWLREESGRWRVALACGCYALALWSKPSALGVLPVLIALEALGLAPSGGWKLKTLRLLPIAALSAVFAGLGLYGHGDFIVEPPGGSMFTAILTDAWILVRYLRNMILPTRLSAVYEIEPLVSLGDARLWLSLAMLAAVAGFTLWAARSRRRALLGWLWFAGALGPHLNLVAIPYPMADRYVYIALPGFFLAFAEAVAGLWDRAGVPEERRRRVLAALSGCGVALLAGLSFYRGFAWRSVEVLFADAATKEPRAAFARYGLGTAFRQAWFDLKDRPDPEARRLAEACRLRWLDEWEAYFEAGDVERMVQRQAVALELGRQYLEHGRRDLARGSFERALAGAAAGREQIGARAEALAWLGLLDREDGRLDAALARFDAAIEMLPARDEFRLQRAATLRMRAETEEPGPARAERLKRARADLARIPGGSPWRAAADAEAAKVGAE
ncbi:MAG: hypothetical protein M5U26_00655 [Planctomycetota bacterium]|nr:hypothetical protein [Planctomycetota bacterium]